MWTPVDNKVSWVIKNFKSLQSLQVCSDHFSIGGCKWQLIAFPESYVVGYLSLFIVVYDQGSLPRRWRRRANITFTVVNQISEKLSKQNEVVSSFDEDEDSCGFPFMIRLSKLHDDDSGFLVNGELKILVQIDVLQVIGKLNESEESSQPLKKEDHEFVGELSKLHNDDSNLLNKTQQLQEAFGVFRFLLLPSQLETVKRIFESYPDLASEVRTDSLHLTITYINVLLGLIQTMCKPPEEFTDDDLKEASSALSCLLGAGFKVDWLEKKLPQVLEKKKAVKSGEKRLPAMGEELLKLNKKCSDHKALLEKERAEFAAAKLPLSLDDFL